MKYAVKKMLDDIKKILNADKALAKKKNVKTSWTKYTEMEFGYTNEIYGILVYFDDINVFHNCMKNANSLYQFPILADNFNIACMPYYDSDKVKDNEYAICFFIYNYKINVTEAEAVLKEISEILDFVELRDK